MKEFNKILVLLTEENYQKEIEVLKNFLNTIKPKNLFFDILIEEHDYINISNYSVKEDIKNALKQQINMNFELIEQNKEEEILKFLLKEDIDLFILFNYKDNNIIDEYIIKLVSKGSANILLIPGEYENLNIKKIMVATDFSDYSLKALEYGEYIQKLFKDSQLKVIHIAAVPVGYHYTGLSLEEFSQKLKENAVLKMKSFLKENIPYEILTVYKHKNVVTEILRLAAVEKMDLLILGSQGINSKIDLIYPGSTTMQMVNVHTLPLLIIKIKEKHKSIWEKIFLIS